MTVRTERSRVERERGEEKVEEWRERKKRGEREREREREERSRERERERERERGGGRKEGGGARATVHWSYRGDKKSFRSRTSCHIQHF